MELSINIIAATVFSVSLTVIFMYLPWTVRRSYRQTFIALARTVEAREPHLLGHAEQTARYVVWMARLRGMSLPATRRMEYAALLHGIGKVSIPFELLNSPACLSRPRDRFVLRDYVRVGAAIFDAIPILQPASDAVRYHHEYLDGSGYPFGRYGRSVPIEAQMLCVASEYVAMTAPRLYRAALSMRRAQADRFLLGQIGRRYSRFVVLLFFVARSSDYVQLALTALYHRLAARIVPYLPPPRLPERVL
jgi:HD-GYP domain-containing protein (c-di-GMP phosphodiesterase class II)